MNIQLLKTKVEDLKFRTNLDEIQDRNSFKMDYEVIFEETIFSLIFSVFIRNSDDFELEFSFKAIFSTDNEVTQDFKESRFPFVNAPAIAFPYLRTFVSNFTLNAGFNPVILPSINFTNYKQNN